MYSHVIIEGPDGAGKTSLAQHFCKSLGFRYHHEGPPPAGVDLLQHYGGLLANAADPTVFDRFHLGEFVYGPLLRGKSGLSSSAWTLMNRLVSGSGSHVIVCLPPFTACEQGLHEQEHIEVAMVRRTAHDMWRSVAGGVLGTIANFHRFDWTAAGDIELRAVPRLGGRAVGSPTARLLLIGEQPNGTIDLPFFGHGPSSSFLLDAMRDAEIPEWDVALVNARDLTGAPHALDAVANSLPNLRTAVPLGKIAHAELIRQQRFFDHDVHVHTIPHPQYWKRFHSKRRDDYVRLLKEAYASVADR